MIVDQMIKDIINSSIWKASSIDETPQIELANWSIYEVKSELWPGITRHFSGYNLTEMEGRASSAIIEFDKEKMIGKTQSGRVYKLSDKRISMSQMGDISWVWDYYKSRNRLTEVTSITHIYASGI